MPLILKKQKYTEHLENIFLDKKKKKGEWPESHQLFTCTYKDTVGKRDRGVKEKKNQEYSSHFQNLRILKDNSMFYCKNVIKRLETVIYFKRV